MAGDIGDGDIGDGVDGGCVDGGRVDGEGEADGLREPVGDGDGDGPYDVGTPDADSGASVAPAGLNSGKSPDTTGPGTDRTNLGPARRAAAGGTLADARADSPGPVGPADGGGWPTATEAGS